MLQEIATSNDERQSLGQAENTLSSFCGNTAHKARLQAVGEDSRRTQRPPHTQPPLSVEPSATLDVLSMVGWQRAQEGFCLGGVGLGSHNGCGGHGIGLRLPPVLLADTLCCPRRPQSLNLPEARTNESAPAQASKLYTARGVAWDLVANWQWATLKCIHAACPVSQCMNATILTAHQLMHGACWERRLALVKIAAGTLVHFCDEKQLSNLSAELSSIV